MFPYVLGGMILAIAAVAVGYIAYRLNQVPKALSAMRKICRPQFV